MFRLSGCYACGIAKCVPYNNPNPKNFKILSAGMNKDFTIATVKYPDCDKFEGVKILVYKGHVLKELMRQTEFDPHFCDGEHLSPIARFAPTDEGLELALNLTIKVREECTKD